jgi:hypothetical protein
MMTETQTLALRVKAIEARSPDAVQHEVMHRRSGVFAGSVQKHSEFATIPGLQRIITLRFMLRCARDTRTRDIGRKIE